MVIDDLHTRFGRSQRVKIAAQAVHRAAPRRQRSDGDRAHGRRRPTPTRSSPPTSGCCWPPSTRRRAASSTRRPPTRPQEYLPHPRPAPAGDPLNDPDDAERAFNARNTLDTLKNVAEWFSSVRGRRKSILFVSEGIDYDINDIIARQRIEPHRRVDGARRDARRRSPRRRGRTSSIYGIDPRGLTDLGDESIEIQRVPGRHVAGRRPGFAAERAAAVAGQPARAVG